MTPPDPQQVAEIAGREGYPHIHKVGRYAFYGVCAFGVSLLAYGAAKAIGFNDEVRGLVTNLTWFVSFLTLRDIEKNAVRNFIQGNHHD